MATLFTLTITANAAGNGGSRKSERAYLHDLLETVAQKLASGAANSDSAIRDRNGANVGSWTYTPVASS